MDQDVLRGVGTAEELVGRLSVTVGRVQELVAGVSEAALDAVPAPGEWSARTVLAHLRDDEWMVMRVRLARMLVEEEAVLAPFDEVAWASRRWRGGDGLAELVEGFAVHRAASLAVLGQMEAGEWGRLGRQPEIGVFDVRWWVEHWAEHDEGHVRQLAEALGR